MAKSNHPRNRSSSPLLQHLFDTLLPCDTDANHRSTTDEEPHLSDAVLFRCAMEARGASQETQDSFLLAIEKVGDPVLDQ